MIRLPVVAWSLADQAIVSLGNVAVSIILARYLNQQSFGEFAFLLALFLFLNSIHQALATYPLSTGTAARPEDAGRHLRNGIVVTLASQGVFIPLVLIAGHLTGTHSGESYALAGFTLALWQLQEVYRRSLMARLLHIRALAADLVRYGTPIALLGVLIAVERLSLVTALQSILVASVASVLVASRLLPWTWRRAKGTIFGDVRDYLHLGHLPMWTAVLSALSVQIFIWLLAFAEGPAQAGALQALANIVALSSPVMYGVENSLMPQIAQRGNATPASAIRSKVLRQGTLGLLLLAPIFVTGLTVPDWLIILFYGRDSSYTGFHTEFRLLVGTYLLFYLSTVTGAALKGCRANRELLRIQVASAATGATVGTCLTLGFGLTGACFASLLSALPRATLSIYYFLRLGEKPLRE